MPKTKEKVTRKYTKKTVPKPAETPALLDVSKKQQVDGKDYENERARPRTLNELWGFKNDKFGTLDEEIYKKKLSIMNKADLQMACIKIGLMPHDSRQTMLERLLKQFRQHVAAANTNNVKPIPLPEMNEELRSILASLGGNTLI